MKINFDGQLVQRFRWLCVAGLGTAMFAGVVLGASPANAAAVPNCAFGVTGSQTMTPECVGPPVSSAPSVATEPASQTVVDGQTASFLAQAIGYPKPTQQWLYSNDGGATWNPFTGDTATTLTITASLAESGDEIEAVFANSLGVVYTDPAVLTVIAGYATTTTLTSSANPQTTYNEVDYTATVPSAPDGDLVDFLDGGTPIVGCASLPLSGGSATCEDIYFTPGLHDITASFQGDASYLPSTSTSLTETINELPAFNSVIEPLAGVGEPFSFQYAATGSPTPTVSLQSGALPTGLTLAADGTVTGTPTKAGTYSFTLQAANGIGTMTFPLSLTVRAKPTVSIANASLKEGNSGTHPMTFTVTLSRSTTVPVTVHWKTANGTATASSDYKAGSGVLTIPAGTTSTTITVQIVGDTTHEANETFKVTLTSPTGASLGTATATGTIVNDD